MLIDHDINSPIRILLLGSDTDIGETFLYTTNSLNEFVITTITIDNFLAMDFSDAKGVIENGGYDFIIDSVSVSKSLPSNYINLIEGLSKWASSENVDVVMLSNSHVFSGITDHSYEESDEPDGKEKYSRRLIQTENIFLSNDCNIILRTGWLFDSDIDKNGDASESSLHGKRNNFIKDTIHSAKTGEPLSYQGDFLGCPTPISDLVRVTLTLVKQRHYGAKNTGVYHYCCAEEISRLNYAKAILSIAAQYDSKIDNTEHQDEFSEDLGEENVDQLRQSLSCRKIFNHFGVKQRPWRANLKNLIKGLYQVD